MTVRRPTVLLLLLALVAALVVPLTVASTRPAGASVTVDMTGLSLDLDYTDHTNISPSPGTDCTGSPLCTGKTVGDVVRFNSVLTVGSLTVDAVVTTVASPYAFPPGPQTGVIERYEVFSATPTQPSAFSFQNDLGTSDAFINGFTFQFYVSGTYTGPETGVPVTLLNVSVVLDDIEINQFMQVTGPSFGYTQSTTSKVGFLPADGRFENVTANGTADEERVVLAYSSLDQLTVYGGDYTGDQSFFEVLFGPGTFSGPTATTGPVVAESLSISTATSVPAIGWSSSPVTDPAGWTAPTCAAYTTADTTFTTPLSGTLSAGVYVTHCTGGTPPAGFTVSAYTDGELVVYAATPTVTSIAPTSGLVAGGTSVTVTGTGFVSGDTDVWIGGVPCTSVTVSSPTSLTCLTGARAAGTVDVFVQTYASLDSTGGTGLYTYSTTAAPTVSAISPTSGPAAGGTSVTVTGTGFAAGATVTVGGVACGSVVVNSATELTCVTGAHAAGVVDVVVTVSSQASTGGTGLFTYYTPSAPTGVTLTAGPGPGRGTVNATAPATGPTPFAYQTRCMPPGTRQTSTAPPAAWVHWPTLPVWIDLTPGYEYRCKVRARYGGPNNEGGGDWNEGPLSEWSNTILIIGAPNAPTGLTRTAPGLPSGRNVTLSWSVTPGGAARPVTGQEAQCTSSTGGVTRTATLTPSARRAQLTALTQGASYTCSVRAVNGVGASAWVAAPAFTVPQAAPRNVVASTPVARATQVSFIPGTGGLAVTNYRAACTSTNGGATRTGTAVASPVTVSNLTAGKQYRCTVTPRIGSTDGATSAPSNPITVP